MHVLVGGTVDLEVGSRFPGGLNDFVGPQLGYVRDELDRELICTKNGFTRGLKARKGWSAHDGSEGARLENPAVGARAQAFATAVSSQKRPF